MRGNPLLEKEAGFPRTPSGKNFYMLAVDHRILRVPQVPSIKIHVGSTLNGNF
jgi:hypothetical protein